MKRILPIIFSFLFLLCSCTVQEEVNTELLVSRFSESFPEYQLETDGIFYEGNKCVWFAIDASGNRFIVEMTSDSLGRIQKISLACEGTVKAENLFSFAKNILSVYAPEEDADSVFQSLANGKYFSYCETLWYGYAFSQTENGVFFSVENKHFAPEKESALTLKESESLIS